jgi:quercetin dioxygenase-like cupin family protein
VSEESRSVVRVIGPDEGDVITFRNGVRMTRKVTSEDTGARWALGVGENPNPGFVNTPHTHTEPEAFYVLEGTYTFFTDGEDREVGPGTLVFIPPGSRHGFVVGPDGGRLLCVWPAAFDGYFWEMNDALTAGTATPEVMDEIAGRHGQQNLPWPD